MNTNISDSSTGMPFLYWSYVKLVSVKKNVFRLRRRFKIIMYRHASRLRREAYVRLTSGGTAKAMFYQGNYQVRF